MIYIYLSKQNKQILQLTLGQNGYNETTGGTFDIKNNELLYYANLTKDHFVSGAIDYFDCEDFYDNAEIKIANALNQASKKDNLDLKFCSLKEIK